LCEYDDYSDANYYNEILSSNDSIFEKLVIIFLIFSYLFTHTSIVDQPCNAFDNKAHQNNEENNQNYDYINYKNDTKTKATVRCLSQLFPPFIQYLIIIFICQFFRCFLLMNISYWNFTRLLIQQTIHAPLLAIIYHYYHVQTLQFILISKMSIFFDKKQKLTSSLFFFSFSKKINLL